MLESNFYFAGKKLWSFAFFVHVGWQWAQANLVTNFVTQSRTGLGAKRESQSGVQRAFLVDDKKAVARRVKFASYWSYCARPSHFLSRKGKGAKPRKDAVAAAHRNQSEIPFRSLLTFFRKFDEVTVE